VLEQCSQTLGRWVTTESIEMIEHAPQNHLFGLKLKIGLDLNVSTIILMLQVLSGALRIDIKRFFDGHGLLAQS
jgi:hypothetical protein